MVFPEGRAVGGDITVDIAVVGHSCMVAIEVNGPAHYFVNEPRVANGWTLVRTALLERCGWHVVNIHYSDLEVPNGV